jgi:hypothetical protein
MRGRTVILWEANNLAPGDDLRGRQGHFFGPQGNSFAYPLVLSLGCFCDGDLASQ